jgi:hypothetical protein
LPSAATAHGQAVVWQAAGTKIAPGAPFPATAGRCGRSGTGGEIVQQLETASESSAREALDPAAMMKQMMEKMEGGASPMEACPMAALFKGKMKKFGVGPALVLLFLGLALIAGGVLIFIDAKVLVWLLAATSIALGIALFFVALGLLRLTAGLRAAAGEEA